MMIVVHHGNSCLPLCHHWPDVSDGQWSQVDLLTGIRTMVGKPGKGA